MAVRAPDGAKKDLGKMKDNKMDLKTKNKTKKRRKSKRGDRVG